MDAIEKVHGEAGLDRRLAVDRAELVWRGFQRAIEERVPSQPIPGPEIGPGLGDSSAEQRTRRRTAYAEFEVKDDTGEVVVKIVDGASGEVIRTVPPDELSKVIQSGEGWMHPWQVLV
ncbi:MAG: flagellar protein FlaG [Anaerolineae bacterium]